MFYLYFDSIVLQSSEIDIVDKALNIETISGYACLLILCAYLYYDNRRLNKENKEIRESNQGFIEKYYTISTKVLEALKNLDNDRKYNR